MKVTGYKSRCVALLMSIVFPLQVMAGACDIYTTETKTSIEPGVFSVYGNGAFEINDGDTASFSVQDDNCKLELSSDSLHVNVSTSSSTYYPTKKSDCGLQPTNASLEKLTSAPPPFDFLGSNNRAPILKVSNSDFGITYKYFKNSGASSRTTLNYYITNKDGLNSTGWVSGNEAYCLDRNTSKCLSVVDNSVILPVWTLGTTNYTAYLSNTLQRDWDTIEADSDGGSLEGILRFQYGALGQPYRIRYLKANNIEKVVFEPGEYYIEQFDINDDTVISVEGVGDGSGVVKLYINNGSEKVNDQDKVFIESTSSDWKGNGVCVNVLGCPSSDKSHESVQYPEKLYIYVYTGNFILKDRVNVAAGIYVANGSLDLKLNSDSYITGEMVAANISIQNNSGIELDYQDTGMFSELYSTGGSTTLVTIAKEGTYSLAAPAVHRVSTTGSLVYVPYQTDYYEKDDGTYSYTGGHLEAFPMNANGTTSSVATWDVNDKMSVWDRYAKLYSVNSTGSTVLFWFLDSAAFASTGSPSQTTIIRYTLDPTYSSSTYLGNRDPDTLIGQPYTTQPVIAENLNLVLFHTDDGFLYAVDATTGGLKWGFMPRANVAGLKDYDGFYKTHSMDGQIAVSEFSSGGSSYAYVVGSAKSGSLHYALKVTANSVEQLWEDTTSGTVAHRPVIFQIGSTYYALYLTGSKDVVVHALTSGASPNTYTMSTSGTLTAAPIVLESFDLSGSSRVQTLTLYLGDSSGYVYEKVLSSSGSASGSLTTVGHMGTTSSVADPVLYLQTATLGGYDYLTAQTGTRLKTFRLPSSSTWKSKWISFIGESGFWNDSGSTYTKETLFTPKAEHVQTLPANAKVTDQVEIAESVVFLPLQVEVEATGTREASCDAYYYLYRLDNGYFPYNTLHNTAPITDNVQVGTGKAFKPSITVKGDSPMLLGHSEQNLPTGAGATNLGVDDAFQFTRGEDGISGWRELVDE
jgi:hypothetical protein